MSYLHSYIMSDENNDQSFKLDHVPRKEQLKFFASHGEHDDYCYRLMAKRTDIENLINLRRLNIIAYGLHGYDPNKPAGPHNLRFLDSYCE